MIREEKSHTIGIEQARAAVDRIANEIAAQYGVSYHWEDNVLIFRRTGVDGRIQVEPARVVVEATLSFWLKPFEGRARTEIRKYLDTRLA